LFYQWPLSFVHRCERRYGKIVQLDVPPFGRLVYLSDPDAILELFSHDGTVAHAGDVVRPAFEPVVGRDSLLILDGERHRAERKLLMPAFTAEAINALEPVIRQATEREVAGWRLGEVVVAQPAMQRVTFDVTAQAVLGVDDPILQRRLIDQLRPVTAIPTSVAVPALRKDFGRFSPWGRFVRAREALNDTLYTIISDRRAGPSRKDVLGVLLATTDERGEPLSDQHIRDEIVTLLFAGHEATATALSWTLERLAHYPDIQREIRAGDRGLLIAVVAETLRVRPVIKEIGRTLSAALEIAGHQVPAGTTIFGGIYLVHLDADNHADPERFDPRRLLGTRPARRTWLPFGGGRRRCIGAGLVELELRTVLEAVLERFELAPASKRVEKPRMRGATLVPAKGARLRIHAPTYTRHKGTGR
jgi:cytochrome P450